MIRAINLGFPRVGVRRELKQILEKYWKGAATRDALLATARELRARHWKRQRSAGIDGIPANDFTLYDHVLDMSCLLGAVPKRFAWDGDTVGLHTRSEERRVGKEGSHRVATCDGNRH